VGALGIAPAGVAWEAEGRVHVVVALLSPATGSEHVRALARIGRLLGQPRVCEGLVGAVDAAQAHALLVAADEPPS
jgi:mannitol/fructose-specific phosphotransferase system IIA component (Ntr-type)